jgi:hypothetical protein
VFTRTRYWSLSWVKWILSTPSHISSLIFFFRILPSTLRSPKQSLPSRFCNQNFALNRSRNVILYVTECGCITSGSWCHALCHQQHQTSQAYLTIISSPRSSAIFTDIKSIKRLIQITGRVFRIRKGSIWGTSNKKNEHRRVLQPIGFNGHGIYSARSQTPQQVKFVPKLTNYLKKKGKEVKLFLVLK